MGKISTLSTRVALVVQECRKLSQQLAFLHPALRCKSILRRMVQTCLRLPIQVMPLPSPWQTCGFSLCAATSAMLIRLSV